MKAVVMTAVTALVLGVAGAASADQGLAQKNACMSCHGVDKKIVGPAFKEVAAKYKADKTAPDRLAKHVKEGTKGNWGQVPMPPNPQVKDEDIKKIIAWIMTL
ncbi:MAG: c-type cytochrome [Hydrogenophilaceae bacterium]|nr:c-type cytochrome [Hydrogenophilaceae bacterium]